MSLPFDKYGVDRKSRLLDEVRAKIRILHYSRSTGNPNPVGQTFHLLLL
ncbi:MAG: hypothetical protein ACYDC8_08285 [Gammaproteobacteria bacterium]